MENKQYKMGDKVVIVKLTEKSTRLEIGQILNVVSQGRTLLTLKDLEGRQHFLPIDDVETYDDLKYSPVSSKTETLVKTIMEFHRDTYINKHLESGDFDTLKMQLDKLNI